MFLFSQLGELDPKGSSRNWLITRSESPLAIVYACEALIRITALGFWVYASDAWNLLDFVVSGWWCEKCFRWVMGSGERVGCQHHDRHVAGFDLAFSEKSTFSLSASKCDFTTSIKNQNSDTHQTTHSHTWLLPTTPTPPTTPSRQVSVSGVLELGGGIMGGVRLTFLRTFRVLRPLKFIKRLKELRVIVEAMLLSLPGLAAVVALCLFFFTLFGIMAVQLYGGVLHSRCRVTPWPVTSAWTPGSDPSLFRCLVKGAAVDNFGTLDEHPGWGKGDSPWRNPQVIEGWCSFAFGRWFLVRA